MRYVRRLALAACLATLAVGGLPAVAPAADGAAAGTADGGNGVDFRKLDTAAAKAEACDDKVRDAYVSGDNDRILAALNEQGKCLEVVLFSVAREFYDHDAFGTGGVEARMDELRSTLGHMYSTIYSEPKTCVPNCGVVYQIWAQEAYVTSIRIMLDDMLDRLKDESPLHLQ